MNFLCFQDIDTIDDQLRAQIQLWVLQTSNVVATIVIICYSTPIFIAVLIPLIIIFAFMQVYMTSIVYGSQITGNSIMYSTAVHTDENIKSNALLTLCEGNFLVTSGFPWHEGQVMLKSFL